MFGGYDPHLKAIRQCEHLEGTKIEDSGGRCDEGLRKQGNQTGTKVDGHCGGEKTRSMTLVRFTLPAPLENTLLEPIYKDRNVEVQQR